MDLKRYQTLKRQLEDLQKEISKAEGGLEQLYSRVKKDFGCDSLEDAKKLLSTKLKQGKTLEENAEQQLERFENKWESKL